MMADCEFFLPPVSIPRDDEWITEDLFDDLPHLVGTNTAKIMAAIDGDFKKLSSRKQSTSTPFTSRVLSVAASPDSDTCFYDDSGFIETSVASSFAGKCTISNASLDGSCIRLRHDSEHGHGDSDAALQVSNYSTSFPDDSPVANFKDCLSIASMSKSVETDSAFGDCSQSQTFSDCASVMSESSEVDSHMDTGISLSASHHGLNTPKSLECTQSSLASLDSCLSSSNDNFSDSLQKVLKQFSPSEPDRLIGRRMGLETLDMISEMQNRNMDCLNLVLSYVTPKDLCTMCRVSQRWKDAVNQDFAAAQRKKTYISALQQPVSQKENCPSKSLDKLHRGLTQGKVPLSPLQPLQRLAEPRIDLTTPSQPKHKQFWQEATQLKNDESLAKCPKCQSPAKTHKIQERAHCTNKQCSYDFCIKCRNPFHGARECTGGIAKKTKTDSTVATKKSKKNLRRL